MFVFLFFRWGGRLANEDHLSRNSVLTYSLSDLQWIQLLRSKCDSLGVCHLPEHYWYLPYPIYLAHLARSGLGILQMAPGSWICNARIRDIPIQRYCQATIGSLLACKSPSKWRRLRREKGELATWRTYWTYLNLLSLFRFAFGVFPFFSRFCLLMGPSEGKHFFIPAICVYVSPAATRSSPWAFICRFQVPYFTSRIVLL